MGNSVVVPADASGAALNVAAVHNPTLGAAVVAAAHDHGISSLVVHALDVTGLQTALTASADPLAVFIHVRGQPLATVTTINLARERAPSASVVGLLDPTAAADQAASAETADDVWRLPADDDVHPFLKARIAALAPMVDAPALTLVVDVSNYRAALGPAVVSLTPTETALLQSLIDDAGQVVSRRTLSTAVWGHEASCGNALERHISCLRRKMRTLSEAVIRTVHGVGYEFVYERYAVI